VLRVPSDAQPAAKQTSGTLRSPRRSSAIAHSMRHSRDATARWTDGPGNPVAAPVPPLGPDRPTHRSTPSRGDRRSRTVGCRLPHVCICVTFQANSSTRVACWGWMVGAVPSGPRRRRRARPAHPSRADTEQDGTRNRSFLTSHGVWRVANRPGSGRA
jgi:hypothetical protein